MVKMSTAQTFAGYLNISEQQAETLISKSLEDCLNSTELKQQLDSLDIQLLRKTLPTAGGVLAEKLPPFYNWLKNELGVKRVPDSPDHTTKWVIGFVNNQESLTRLVELHRPVPKMAIERSISVLIGAFDGVEDETIRQQWQKAVAALCVPLVVDAREREKTGAN